MATLVPRPPRTVPEEIAIGGSPTRADIDLLDAESGLDIGRCNVDS